MYRDFLYLDIERVQSIVAQLEKGLLEKVLEGRTGELEGKASVAAGVLASFLPFGIEGGIHRQHEVQATKVLHDYAFTVALDALNRESLYLEVGDDWNRENLLLPDGTFVLARGRLSIIDYGLLKGLADNASTLEVLFRSKQSSTYQKGQAGQKQKSTGKSTRALKDMWALVDAFMGDAIHIRLSCSDQLLLVGPVLREYLRERTRDLIFKYGGKPREGWSLLAQINQVTEPFNKLASLAQLTTNLSGPSDLGPLTLTDMLNPVIEVLNVFQEALASVSYPAISITPIALYRELDSVR
jgi:hypothetical protein